MKKNCLLRSLLFAFCILWFAGTVCAAGLSRPYTHYADGEELSAVLINFARSQGFGANISPAVQGNVSGRFEAVPPVTFLKGMQAAFGVSWYQLGNTLYFYNESETTRTFITPRVMSAERLFAMLRKSAVFSPQLPATLAPGGAMITVSGPPSYISQILAAVTAFEEAQTSSYVMKVFPPEVCLGRRHHRKQHGQDSHGPRCRQYPEGYGYRISLIGNASDSEYRYRGQARRNRACRSGQNDSRCAGTAGSRTSRSEWGQ